MEILPPVSFEWVWSEMVTVWVVGELPVTVTEKVSWSLGVIEIVMTTNTYANMDEGD